MELESGYQDIMEVAEMILFSQRFIKCKIAAIILCGFDEAGSRCSILPGRQRIDM